MNKNIMTRLLELLPSDTGMKLPLTQNDRFIDVIASMVEITSTHIILQAEVRNEKGKLAAKGMANCVFIKERK